MKGSGLALRTFCSGFGVLAYVWLADHCLIVTKILWEDSLGIFTGIPLPNGPVGPKVRSFRAGEFNSPKPVN